MRKTLFTIFGLIVIVVIAFLVSPYFVGSTVQENYQQQIQKFNKSSPYITITPQDYKRSWFDSKAKVKVSFHLPKGMASSNTSKDYTFDAVLKHGPVFKSNGGLHMGRGALVIESNTPEFKGTIDAIMGWNGKLDIEANIPKLSFSDHTGNKITFNNATLTTKEGQNGNTVHSFKLANIHVDAKGKHFGADINDVTFTSKGKEHNNLWLGKLDAAIQNAKVGVEAGANLMPMGGMEKLTLGVNTNLTTDKTKLSSDMDLNIQSISAMGQKVSPITLNYGIDGINAKSYDQFMDVIRKLQSSGSFAKPSTDDAMTIVSSISGILESGFQIKLNKLYVGLPKTIGSSPISANAQVTLAPMGDLFQKVMGDMATAGMQPHAAGAAKSVRDNALASLTHEKAQPGSAQAQNLDQMKMKLQRSLPMLTMAFMKAASASGKASGPINLIKQALASNYKDKLAHMAARGMTVSDTAAQLGDKAYDYLVHNKMLIASGDGAVKASFTFKDGKLLINGQPPALALPQPSVATPAPSTDTHHQ